MNNFQGKVVKDTRFNLALKAHTCPDEVYNNIPDG